MARSRGFDIDLVLDAAMGAFWDRGYAETSAQDLVDGTGLGRGSLYNAFGSKHGLFEAALRRYDEQTSAPTMRRLEDEGRPAMERLREFLESVVREETAPTPGRRGCLVVNSAMELAGRDEKVAEVVRRTFERMENALTTCVRHGQAEGVIGADRDPRELAQYLLSSMYGLRVMGKVADRQVMSGVVEKVLLSL
ncbi:TetR/AcrR family transcriptional regulator [Streptomyces sp. NPDC049879]|uniref:TetR/AcrR family transcriptional regulator n=1 Tax=Streptomyces sp. NPDC049879 TaxID=3365598 RepID=UPI00378D5759